MSSGSAGRAPGVQEEVKASARGVTQASGGSGFLKSVHGGRYRRSPFRILAAVTIELARRLFESGLVAGTEIEAALAEVTRSGVPLVRALFERGANLAELVERELRRSKLPSVSSVRAEPDVAARLPAGLCERLLAVPVRDDRKTGTIDVACVDPFDAHVAGEIGFHLGAPVRLLRARYGDVVAALDGLHAGGTFLEGVARALGQRTPAFGASAPLREALADAPASASGAAAEKEPLPAAAGPSERPIPLVKKSNEPKRARRGTNPGVGESALPPVRTLGEDADGEPILGLTRSKPPPSPIAPQASARPAPALTARDLAPWLDRMAAAHAPDEVVDALGQALHRVAPRVVLLASKAGVYEGKSAFGIPEGASVRELCIPSGAPSVIETAAGAGFYLGPIPDTGPQAEIGRLLGAGADTEAYVVPVDVSGRAALIVVLAGFDGAFGATRLADRLVRAAGDALQRIVRGRKRGAR